MAKFEASVAHNEATWRLFSYNSKTLSNVKTSRKMITFLRRNDYLFKKKWLRF